MHFHQVHACSSEQHKIQFTTFALYLETTIQQLKYLPKTYVDLHQYYRSERFNQEEKNEELRDGDQDAQKWSLFES